MLTTIQSFSWDECQNTVIAIAASAEWFMWVIYERKEFTTETPMFSFKEYIEFVEA